MAGFAGCLDASPFSEEAEGIPSEIEAVLDQKWQAKKENEPETYQELYHSESPIRDSRWWDSDRWHETFRASSETFEYTIEHRELLEQAETEATVREVIYREDNLTGSHRGGSTDRITYDLRIENDDWRIFDEESEKYYPWMGNGDEYAPEDFEPCNREIISISWLPKFVQSEVRTALDDGVYEAEELYLPHLMDVETSYLRKTERDTYRAHVTETGDGYRLELEEATPSIGVSDFEVNNATETEQTVTVRFERESPVPDVGEMETIFEGTDTLSPDERIVIEFERYFVDHRINVETDEITEVYESEWTERGPRGGSLGGVTITNEEILPEPRPQAELEDCRDVWERALTSE